jgi:hypothetical protein
MLQRDTCMRDVQEVTLPVQWKLNENVKSNSLSVRCYHFSS